MSALAPEIRSADAGPPRGDQIWREIRSEASSARPSEALPDIAPGDRAPSEPPSEHAPSDHAPGERSPGERAPSDGPASAPASRPLPDPALAIAPRDRSPADRQLIDSAKMQSTDPAPSIAPDSGTPPELSARRPVPSRVEPGDPANRSPASDARAPVRPAESKPAQLPAKDSKRNVAKKDDGLPRPIRSVPAPSARIYPAPPQRAGGGENNSVRDQSPNDSIRRPALFGWVIIALFFGVLGGWALFAPLHGAVVANGVIKVEGNRKSEIGRAHV